MAVPKRFVDLNFRAGPCNTRSTGALATQSLTTTTYSVPLTSRGLLFSRPPLTRHIEFSGNRITEAWRYQAHVHSTPFF